MPARRTIHISRATGTAAQTETTPRAWIVRVDGQEFTHGHVHALEFELPEDAARFAADLASDYGPGVQVAIVGLDALGVPVDPPLAQPEDPAQLSAWLTVNDVAAPRLRHPRDPLLAQVASALFANATAAERMDLVVALYRHDLTPTRLRVLRMMEPAFAVARLKQTLPAEFVAFAEVEAAFRAWRRLHGR
jgi:hypothetical protein